MSKTRSLSSGGLCYSRGEREPAIKQGTSLIPDSNGALRKIKQGKRRGSNVKWLLQTGGLKILLRRQWFFIRDLHAMNWLWEDPGEELSRQGDKASIKENPQMS